MMKEFTNHPFSFSPQLKKITLLFFLSFFLLNLANAQAAITVSSSCSNIPGTYTYDGFYNGKQSYIKGFIVIRWQNNRWEMRTVGFFTVLLGINQDDTSLPPCGNWTPNGSCTSTTTITLSGGCNAAPLPVELISFKAQAENEKSMLEWSTASEVNNEGFEIEHSTDGRNWGRIDFVAGFGNIITQQNYSYLHKSPIEGLNYYRLKQVDYDGDFSYSDIEVVTINIDKVTRIYPSLATNEINVQLNQAANRGATIEIFDFMGRIVHVENLEEDSFEHVINISNLHQGHYILRINMRGNNFSDRFLKK